MLAIIVLYSIVLAKLSITSSSLEEIMLLRIGSESLKMKSLIEILAIDFPAVIAAPPTGTRLLLYLILELF